MDYVEEQGRLVGKLRIQPLKVSYQPSGLKDVPGLLCASTSKKLSGICFLLDGVKALSQAEGYEEEKHFLAQFLFILHGL